MVAELPVPNRRGARDNKPGKQAAPLFSHRRSLGCRATGTVTIVTCAIPQTAPGDFAKQTEHFACRPNSTSAKLPTSPAAGRGHRQPRRAATPPLLASPAASPALPRAEDARRASAGTGGTDPRSQLTFQLLPSRAQPPSSPKSGSLQKSTRRTPANHLSSSPRLAEHGTDHRRLPPRGAERDPAPSGTRGSARRDPRAIGYPKLSQRRRKKLISRDKAAAVAKARCDGMLPEQLVSPNLKQGYKSISNSAKTSSARGPGCPRPQGPSPALPRLRSPGQLLGRSFLQSASNFT